MSTGELLNVEPVELKFAFELKKQISCSLQLLNKTENHVAFKVKTTNPKKYCVRPNTGVVLPGSTCDVTVTMQAQKEAPPDMQCKDKFLLQSVVATAGVAPKDITPEMFSKQPGRVVEECRLRVIYLPPPQPPSPVLEEPDEGVSPKVTFDTANLNVTEARSLISKLVEEKNAALQQCSKVRQEMELLTSGTNKSQGGGVSIIIVIAIGLIGLLLGYLMKN
ncbi:vesicle-associated protein 1-1-like [Rutidosis leptorrhynchoides]|uniref:vesicle-associated protein 1-1-like n=1 Tax=Rutidosis leptorrhynchoides TaxID=125765 RepID=UPI003A99A81B